MKVVCVGDCGVDHYLSSGQKRVGGITANFARHAQRLLPPEDEIHIVSCVGNDDGADLVLAALDKTGIACHISRLPGRTPVQSIEIEDNGEKRFVRYDEGVLREFSFGPTEREIISSGDLVVAPVYLQIVDLFDELMSIETRGLVAIDFADFLQHPDFTLLEKHIAGIDIGFFGLATSDKKSISRIAELASVHGKLFVVTLGADGSVAFRSDQVFHCAATPVSEVVDTTGAGDAFAAAFLARYCHGFGVDDAMRRGAEIAAGVITTLGSWS